MRWWPSIPRAAAGRTWPRPSVRAPRPNAARTRKSIVQCGNQPVRQASLEVLFTIVAASAQCESAWRPRTRRLRLTHPNFDFRTGHSWAISKGTPTQPGMMLYYLDLCWIANFLLAFSFMAVLVEVLEERYLGTRTVGALNARAVSQAPTAGLIAHLIATGPLLWSVFILPCKMVLRPRLLRGEVADATAAGPARHRQLREHLDSLVARLHRCGNQPVS